MAKQTKEEVAAGNSTVNESSVQTGTPTTSEDVRVVNVGTEIRNNPDEKQEPQDSTFTTTFSADSSQAMDAINKINEALGEAKPQSRAHVIIDRVPDAPVLTSIAYNDSLTETASLEQSFFDPEKDSFAVNADVAAAATNCLHCATPKAAHSDVIDICVVCNQGIGSHTGNNKCRDGKNAEFKKLDVDGIRCADGTKPVFAFSVNPDSRVKLLSDVEANQMLKEREAKAAQVA